MIKLILPSKEDTKLDPVVFYFAIAIGTAAGCAGAFVALTS